MNLVSTPDPTDFVFGGGGFVFGFGDTCFTPGQSPCPPTVLVDDGIPGAPGDLVGTLSTAPMTLDFLSLGNDFGTATADLLRVDPSPPIPCPEPGLVAGLVVGGGAITAGSRRRPRRRQSRQARGKRRSERA